MEWEWNFITLTVAQATREKRNVSSPTRSLLTSPDAIPLSHTQFQPITSTTPIWVVTRRVISMEFLRSFLRRHLAGKRVVASQDVGCFLRPCNRLCSFYRT